MNKLQLTSIVVAALAASQMAQAALTITSSVGGGAPAGTTKYDLNTGNGSQGDLTVTLSGNAQALTGPIGGVSAPPYFSGANDVGFGGAPAGPDTTQYLTTGDATGAGSVTLSFATPLTYIGFVWGSVDDYNTLKLMQGSTTVATITPPTAGLPLPDPMGDQNVVGTYWVNISSTIPFDTVIATSTRYAFEFDNVATIAVPEPSTYVAGALLLLPFGASAVRAWRRQRGE